MTTVTEIPVLQVGGMSTTTPSLTPWASEGWYPGGEDAGGWLRRAVPSSPTEGFLQPGLGEGVQPPSSSLPACALSPFPPGSLLPLASCAPCSSLACPLREDGGEGAQQLWGSLCRV